MSIALHVAFWNQGNMGKKQVLSMNFVHALSLVSSSGQNGPFPAGDWPDIIDIQLKLDSGDPKRGEALK
jgi:hypothetical protein